jgi:N-acetylmuramoyl-L-alanine amidase
MLTVPAWQYVYPEVFVVLPRLVVGFRSISMSESVAMVFPFRSTLVMFGIVFLLSIAADSYSAPSEGSKQKLIVCIDPGHPSEVSDGTAGRHVTEIQANWKIAQLVEADLIADDVRVVMTKSSEQQFVTNKHRAEIANKAHADIMVRLHCDGGNGIGSGFAVYAPDREGRVDGISGPSSDVIHESQKAGRVFYETVATELHGTLPARGFHSDMATHVGAQHGALIGSIYSKVPVVLIEMCVLTNPHDEAFILSKSGSEKMARAIADGAEKAVSR